MSSPERGGPPSERPASHEQRAHSYYRAARFAAIADAGPVYAQIEAVIRTEVCDVSAFRFERTGAAYVAVLGAPPPSDLDQQVADLLATGDPVTLPPTWLAFLVQRRAQARRLGPWVERHVRPVPPHDLGASDA